MTDKTTKNEMAAMAAMMSNPADVAFLFQIWEEREALRAELDAAPTATLRQQLAGSQAALSKVMGELTEARADNQRLTAELAQLVSERNEWKRKYERDDPTGTYRRYEVTRAELAQARAERDRVYDDTERTRYDIWALAEDYKDKWVKVDPKGVAEDIRDLLQAGDRPPLIERQRRTIRALVVSNRAMWKAMYHFHGRSILVRERMDQARQAKQSGQQAGE